MKKIAQEGADIIPIMSFHAYELDTIFGDAQKFIDAIKDITGKEEIIHTIQGAEPIGPKQMTDILLIAPCTRKYTC